MKTLLILIDGMRPDAITEHPVINKLVGENCYTFNARTVFPSVTLPCHMSLFYSVEPQRHGVTTNYYTPPVHSVTGLIEHLNKNKKKCAVFYNWEELRDISRPGNLAYSHFLGNFKNSMEETDKISTDKAIEYINSDSPDFVFLYLGDVDEVGHKYGWMSSEYMKSVDNALKNAQRIMEVLPEEYSVILTADHGGHDRLHGLDIPEDMIIPVFVKKAGEHQTGILEDASILDIAPTICEFCGVEIPEEWEGKSLLNARL